MKKQILSAAIAVCCMANALPVTALAASEPALIQGTFRYMPAFTEDSAQESFFYSDAYFSAPSTEKNQQLCSMSMALAFSTFEIGGSSYVTDLLEQIGYEDIQITDISDHTSADTIGTVIARKRIDGQDVVAVAVRGSKYCYEWLSDLTAGAEGNIKGFDDAAQKVTDRIRAYISENQLDNVKLWIAGYSRAGAVADLTGVYINEHMAEFETTAEDLYVYSFATPLCSASETVYDNIWCVINRNDLATYVYPAEWGLHRNGREIRLGEDKTITSVSIDLTENFAKTEHGEILISEFLPAFFGFISDELTREVYAKHCDKDVPALMEMFLDRPLNEWKPILDYLKNDFLTAAQEKAAERIGHLLAMDIILGIVSHNSDKMYEQLTKDLKELIFTVAAETDCPLTDAELTALTDHLYGLLRAAGPVLVRDMLYCLDADYSTLLSEDYYDPDYDPAAGELPDYEAYSKMEEERRLEEEERERNKTQEERDAEAGADAAYSAEAYSRGYDDAVNGIEPLTEPVMPEDAERFSAAYLDAYAETYMSEYESGYENGLSSLNPDYYELGYDASFDTAYDAAQKDAETEQYEASYDDTVPAAEDGSEHPEAYIKGYQEGYREKYDYYYQSNLKEMKKRPFYHLGTFFTNLKALTSEHYAQTYFSLIKSLDSNYNALTAETEYIDESGNKKTVMAYPFDAENPVLVNGWYAVSGDVSADSTLILGTDVNLILTDGSSLTVSGISGNNALRVFTQDEASGKLTVGSTVSAASFTQYGGTVQIISDAENALECSGDVSVLGGSFTAEKAIQAGGTITLDYKSEQDTIKAGAYHAKNVAIANDHVFYIPDFPKEFITDYTCDDIGTAHLTYNGETQKITKEDLIGKLCYYVPVVSNITLNDTMLELMQNQVLVPDPGVSPYSNMQHRTFLTADDFALGAVQAGKEVSEDGYPCFYDCEVIGKGIYSGTATIHWWISEADVSDDISVSANGDIPYTGKKVTAEQFTFASSSALGQELLDELRNGQASLKQQIFAAKEISAAETTDTPVADRFLAKGHIYDLHELIGDSFLVISSEPFTVAYPGTLDSTVYVMQDGVKKTGCVEIDGEGALCYYQMNADGEDIFVREKPQAYANWCFRQDNNTFSLECDLSESQISDGIEPGDYLMRFTVSSGESEHFENVVKYVPFTVLPKQIASDETLCKWAQKDYADKNGTKVTAEITEKSAQELTIALKDSDGRTVDTYVIGTETGTGTDAAGDAVDLPQTGNNDRTGWMMVFGAFCMIGAGWFCLKQAGIRLHKKEQ